MQQGVETLTPSGIYTNGYQEPALKKQDICSRHVNFKNREIRSFQWQQRRCHSMYDHCGTDVLKQKIIERTAYT